LRSSAFQPLSSKARPALIPASDGKVVLVVHRDFLHKRKRGAKSTLPQRSDRGASTAENHPPAAFPDRTGKVSLAATARQTRGAARATRFGVGLRHSAELCGLSQIGERRPSFLSLAPKKYHNCIIRGPRKSAKTGFDL